MTDEAIAPFEPDYFTDRAGKHRFRVVGENGEKVITSQGYASRFNAERGFATLKRIITEEKSK